MKDEFAISVIYVQADSNLKTDFEIVETTRNGIHEIIVYFKSGNGIFGKIINARRYKKAQQVGFEKIRGVVNLCHVHVPYRPAFLALQLKKEKSIPFVVTEHWSGHLTGEYHKKNTTDKTIYKSVLKKASAISCVSHLLAAKFKQNTGFDSVVIPNYIEVNLQQSVKSSDNLIHVLSVSDLVDDVKNISGLLHAFSTAVKQNNSLYLTLVGGGPDEEKIKNLVSTLHLTKSVSLKGRLSHEDVLKEMQNCDFYICNSNFETFGMTVAEALSAGKPVICSRCGGPEEFLNSENSILVDTKNNQHLSDAILKMATTFKNFDTHKLSHEMEIKFGKEAVKKMWKAFYEEGFNVIK